MRCDVCIEEDCGGRKACNCDICPHINECNKVLHPILRITTQCTQQCSHCCWECSPLKTAEMTRDKAKEISSFLLSNNIRRATIMGGEICCHSNWEQILTILINPLERVRLVTNGDTIVSPCAALFLKDFPQVHISISKDRWHTNKNVEKAISLCEAFGLPFNVATEEQTTDESIVPVGGGEFHSGVYSFFSCYCDNPLHKYSFLIDEDGFIYKCGFGQWSYAKTSDYRTGGFALRFKEFNQLFYGEFIGNCRRCSQASTRAGRSGLCTEKKAVE